MIESFFARLKENKSLALRFDKLDIPFFSFFALAYLSVFRLLCSQGHTTTANGRLFFGIFAALAEFERALIAERLHAGLAAARARGCQGGRPRKMNRPKIMMAMTAMADPKAHAAEGARRLNITTTTRYMYVNVEASWPRHHARGVTLLNRTSALRHGCF